MVNSCRCPQSELRGVWGTIQRTKCANNLRGTVAYEVASLRGEHSERANWSDGIMSALLRAWLRLWDSRTTRCRWLIVLLIGVGSAVLGSGCAADSSEQAGSEESAAEASADTPRRTIDAQARSILLEGEQAFQQGQYDRAFALADSAEQYAPEAAVVPFFRGSIYTALNRVDEAKAAFQEALARDSLYPEAHYRIGNLEQERGRMRAALNRYRAEARIAPTSALYAEMGAAYAELGVPDSARWAYEQALAQDSTNASTHMRYGQFLEETGDLEAALEHSRQAQALQPDRPNYQFAVGSQLYQLGRLEEAVDPLRRAADARLLHYPAQYTLGQVLVRLGEDEDAERYLARADTARELMDRITTLQEAVAQQPDAVASWIELGALYHRAEEPQRALQAYSQAVRLEPGNLTAQHRIGELLLAVGETEAARQRFQMIVDAAPDRVETWLHLGRAHATAGDCEAARRAWKTALQYRPDDRTAQQYLDDLCQYEAQ